MATIINAMPEIKRPGRVPKYPWAEWLDGNARLLEQGTDFESEPRSFRTQAYKVAKEHAVKISVVTVTDTTLALQAQR